MKFIVDLNGSKVVLNQSQLEILTTALTGAERLRDIDVGKNNGTHGYSNQYIDGIKEFHMRTALQISVLSEDEYEALKFVSKQHPEKS